MLSHQPANATILRHHPALALPFHHQLVSLSLSLSNLGIMWLGLRLILIWENSLK